MSEIECPDCSGNGFIPPQVRMGESMDCTACEGTGWREMTPDEEADAAERYAEDAASEPPVTMDEMHRAAWHQKQTLKR